ncbi:MAG TPA: hypothetical protein VF933_23885, partial [Streptosporangiaceae bacterium]
MAVLLNGNGEVLDRMVLQRAAQVRDLFKRPHEAARGAFRLLRSLSICTCGEYDCLEHPERCNVRIRLIPTLLAVALLASSCSSQRVDQPLSYSPPRNLDALLGESAKVQTTWDADSSMIATTGELVVDVPLRLRAGVRIAAGPESFAVKLGGADAQARLVAPGVALFPNTARQANTAIQVLGDRGVRFISVLTGASAPSSLSFSVLLPSGA